MKHAPHLSLRGLACTGLAALMLLTGCEVRVGAPKPKEDPKAAALLEGRQQATTRVLQLRADNRISDSQTLFALSVLNTSPDTDLDPLLAKLQEEYAATKAPVASQPATGAPTAPAAAPTQLSEMAQAIARIPAYQPQAQIGGRLRSIGSDTMDEMMQRLETAFRQHHDKLQVLHEGKGSSTAAPAVLEGRADVGPMSRPAKPAELAKFQERFGREPIQVRIALDALAVYAHPDNPLLARGLSLRELDGIFSATRKRGGADLTLWGQLGAPDTWAAQPIRVYSRNTASGTYGFFKDLVLQGGDYRSTNQELDGSADVVAACARDPLAIGYSGIGYRTPNVAVMPLRAEDGMASIPPGQEAAMQRTYPLARDLYLLVLPDAQGKFPEVVREALNFILSREGQTVVQQSGFYPLTIEAVTQERQRLGL